MPTRFSHLGLIHEHGLNGRNALACLWLYSSASNKVITLLICTAVPAHLLEYISCLHALQLHQHIIVLEQLPDEDNGGPWLGNVYWAQPLVVSTRERIR